jgi:2-oxo-3-(phosphooxy)propyl 3-oxoalkanoate synthase
LVHRSSVAEVFVTDSLQVGPDHYAVAAQLPRGHVMQEQQIYDPSLLVETARQAGVLVSHRHLDVPMDRAFVMNRLTMRITNIEALSQGESPGRLTIDFTTSLNTNSRGRMRGYEFTGGWVIDGATVAEGTGSLTFMSKRAHQMLRTQARSHLDPDAVAAPTPLPATPATVGRRDRRNVVITEPAAVHPNRWSATIAPDFSHPHLFDHPLDHLPGNLVIEASRQLTVAAVAKSWGVDPSRLVPVGLETTFTGYCENDITTALEAEVSPFRRSALGLVAGAEVDVTQCGTTLSTVRVEVVQCT